ncbi:hypothetical protein COO60DRAFT_419692 [Scenedesmus sp. NREL 46B-D3]|nr:hypothetical protein COO60DRAFT_419692 [Scenedesmus sp. NREL 46B-D3]
MWSRWFARCSGCAFIALLHWWLLVELFWFLAAQCHSHIFLVLGNAGHLQLFMLACESQCDMQLQHSLQRLSSRGPLKLCSLSCYECQHCAQISSRCSDGKCKGDSIIHQQRHAATPAAAGYMQNGKVRDEPLARCNRAAGTAA